MLLVECVGVASTHRASQDDPLLGEPLDGAADADDRALGDQFLQSRHTVLCGGRRQDTSTSPSTPLVTTAKGLWISIEGIVSLEIVFRLQRRNCAPRGCRSWTVDCPCASIRAVSGTGSTAPTGVKVVMWALAIGVAAVGIVAAVASGSWWPLIAFAGLFLPMLPIASPRSRSSASGRK